MNETVKAALLSERESARNSFGYHAREIGTLRRRLAEHEVERDRQERRLCDVELHLRDNGVDLAAVDAEAEKARPKPSPLSAYQSGYGQQSLIGNAAADYQNALGGVNTNLGQAYSSLARAFDEA